MSRPPAALLVTALAFAALGTAAALAGTLPADAALREALLGLGSPPVLAAMRVINHAGAWRVLLPATALLVLGFPRARRRWWVWLALMVVAPLAETAAKELVGRPRPEDASLGFPSGHATAAAAFFGAVIALAGSLPRPASRVVRALAVLAIVLVGLARVLLRAHWPSDVLGGIALGLTLAAAAAWAASTQPGPAPPR